MEAGFENQGQFIFWVERQAGNSGKSRKAKIAKHPDHLAKVSELSGFLSTELSLTKVILNQLAPSLITVYITLPCDNEQQPLPSPEMAQLTGQYPPDNYHWRTWEVSGLHIAQPLLFLRELQFISRFKSPHFRPGSDLLFWIQYAQQLRNMIRQHQFIPVLKCYQSARKGAKPKVYTGWSPAGQHYEQGLQAFAAAMPGICTTTTHAQPENTAPEHPECLNPIDLLRHFSEQQTEQIVMATPVTKQLLKQLGDSWLVDALGDSHGHYKTRERDDSLTIHDWQQWHHWQKGLSGPIQEQGFVLGLRLQPATSANENDWWLHFFAQSAQDPSLKIDLAEWWALSAAKQKQWLKQLGQQFERHLLVNMGHAARICPLLWQGLESTRPSGLPLDLAQAYEFLKNDAAVLESAGFKIVLPGWWTPQGRKRARIRVKASGKSAPSQEKNTGSGYFALPSLVEYRYELAVGGEPVTAQEWQELVNAKSPLVQFRGEWMELHSEQMAELLALWQQQEEAQVALSVSDLIKQAAEADAL